MIYWQSHSMNTMGMFVCLSLTKKIHTYTTMERFVCCRYIAGRTLVSFFKIFDLYLFQHSQSSFFYITTCLSLKNIFICSLFTLVTSGWYLFTSLWHASALPRTPIVKAQKRANFVLVSQYYPSHHIREKIALWS